MTEVYADYAEVFDPLLDPVRYKFIEGGRGSGKSWFEAQDIAITAAQRPGFQGLGVREVQKSIKSSSKRLIENAVTRLRLGGFQFKRDWIKTPGGGEINFIGMQNHTAESVKSFEGLDYVWWDEAQRASQTSLDLLIPTIREAGSVFAASWNPRGHDDPIERLKRELLEEQPERIAHVVANYWDNPWFPEDLRLDMERDRRRDPDKYAHVWCGKFRKNSEARVFRNYREEEFETPGGVVFLLGADWGFSNDPTVLVRSFVQGQTLFVDQEAYKVGCKIVDTPALFDQVEQARQWKIIADSARPETIDHMKDQGFKIEPARKGPGSVEEGVNFLKDYDIVVHPRCKHTIDELAFYSYKVDPRTDEVTPLLEDKKNHVIDALRYSVEKLRRKSGRRSVRGGAGVRHAR
ncbi:MAG: PBSX family phage terminase large subunit [Pseudomonadota bacterium]